MPFVIEQSDLPDIVSTETFTLSLIIDLYAADSNSQFRRMDARLTIAETPTGAIDGVNKTFTLTHEPSNIYRNGTDETSLGTVSGNTFTFATAPAIGNTVTGRVIIPIHDFQYDEGETDFAGTLQVQLANLSDRSLIARDTPFRFETGEFISSAWVWSTLLDTAKLRQSDYRLANQNDTPADSFAVTFQSLLQSRLDTTPLGTIVLYDPAKVTVSDQDLLNIPDIDGVDNPVTATAKTALSVYKIFEYAAAACGFSGYTTNIPDFPIRRIDFNAGNPYFAPVGGIVGMFQPIFDYDAASDKLIIRDGTADFQPDTTAARSLTFDDVTQIGLSNEIERFKGCLITYQLQGTGWDYWLETVDHFLNPPGGIGTLVTASEVVTRKYYRNSFPNTPVNENVSRQTDTTTVNTFTTFKRVNETFSYDGMGNLLRRERDTDCRLPVQTQWPTLTGFDVITYFNDDGSVADEHHFPIVTGPEWTFKLIKAEAEIENYVYLAHPYEAQSIYIAYRELNKAGIVIVDAENQQLGQDYSNSLLQAAQQGQVETYQNGKWAGISNFREWQIPFQNRQVKIITQIVDLLNTNAGLTTEPVHQPDVRVGDIGIQAIKQITKQVYVNDGGDATATLIKPINGGEAPLSVLRPLATRINKKQFVGGKVQSQVPGIDLSLTKGRAVTLSDRAGTSFGTFRIVSRHIEGGEGKFTTSFQAVQMVEAS